MVLVDIGNTHYHILENGKIYNLKEIKKFNDEVFYISVNSKKEKEFLKLNKDAINLKNYVNFKTEYKNLGIDRVMACIPIKDGVVIDAGSAVTIDIMEKGVHKGGIIMPGIYSFKKAFLDISEVLKMEIRDFNLDKIPQNTNEALLYGSIGAILKVIKSFKSPYYFTGGDGEFLSKFVDGIYIKDLVFRGMREVIKEIKSQNHSFYGQLK